MAVDASEEWEGWLEAARPSVFSTRGIVQLREPEKTSRAEREDADASTMEPGSARSAVVEAIDGLQKAARPEEKRVALETKKLELVAILEPETMRCGQSP